MTVTTRPNPALEQWAAVVIDQAGNRCQCVTAHHTGHRTPGRCEATSGDAGLIAGPRDPGPRPELRASAPPVSELQAWCPPCWDNAVKLSRRYANRAATLRLRAAEGLW